MGRREGGHRRSLLRRRGAGQRDGAGALDRSPAHHQRSLLRAGHRSRPCRHPPHDLRAGPRGRRRPSLPPVGPQGHPRREWMGRLGRHHPRGRDGDRRVRRHGVHRVHQHFHPALHAPAHDHEGGPRAAGEPSSAPGRLPAGVPRRPRAHLRRPGRPVRRHEEDDPQARPVEAGRGDEAAAAATGRHSLVRTGEPVVGDPARPRRLAPPDPLPGRRQGARPAGTGLRHVRRSLRGPDHRDQPGRVPGRARLRRLAVRLPRQHRPAVGPHRLHHRRPRPRGLADGGRRGARRDRSPRRPGDRPLRGIAVAADGAAGGDDGRAVGDLLAGHRASPHALVQPGQGPRRGCRRSWPASGFEPSSPA